MNNDIWKTVSEEYEEAKKCLWCPKHASYWQRDEDEGMFHLWQAYHTAIHANEKNDLLFARVLMMMSDEQHNIYSYDRFHKYVEPAMEAYNRAAAAGITPGDKELEKAKFYYESLKYELEKTANNEEQCDAAYRQIPGLNDILDFNIHDSKPVHFEHDSNSAELSLKYDDITVTFSFDGLVDIEVNGDPTVNWINDFYCYPAFHNKNLIIFDIGYYRILCKNIKVSNVARK